MGHDFLSIRRGEEIDVVFEIGRVDELDAFPLDVGRESFLLSPSTFRGARWYTKELRRLITCCSAAVEDDGLLIGRDQNGLQGFVLCSFLVSFNLCFLLFSHQIRMLPYPLRFFVVLSRHKQHPIEVNE